MEMSEQLRWLEGHGFWEWLDSKGVQPKHLTESEARGMNRWKKGERCDFYKADPMLVRLGLNESDIPSHLWTVRRCASKWTGKREEAERLLCQGLSVAFVVRDLKVPRSTVVGWRRGLKLEGKIDGKEYSDPDEKPH